MNPQELRNDIVSQATSMGIVVGKKTNAQLCAEISASGKNLPLKWHLLNFLAVHKCTRKCTVK